MNYYNENNPKAAAWLRVLIDEGTIPAGKIDERSITDVRAADLDGFQQCHFFAGIGGWAEALRLAAWREEEEVWTASLPCQPFSLAGDMHGTADERHLWPVFAELVRARQPAIVFGEQVASAAGREWLAGVSADLEAMAYRVAGADLCAAGIGSPQIRQRLYWFACGLSYPQRAGLERWLSRREDEERQIVTGYAGRCGAACDFWDTYDILNFRDGKCRRIESGTFPLVDGFPARVAVLEGFGNAICPQLAAQFICAASEAVTDYFAGA